MFKYPKIIAVIGLRQSRKIALIKKFAIKFEILFFDIRTFYKKCISRRNKLEYEKELAWIFNKEWNENFLKNSNKSL